MRIRSGGTVTLKAGAVIKGCAIAPEGMTFPQSSASAWTGTGITIAGDQTLVRDCLVVGFALGYTSTARSRNEIHNLYVDCISGCSFDTSYDTQMFTRIHAWPFATIEAYAASLNKLPDGDPNKTVDGYDARINRRGGTGLKFRGSNDDTQLFSAIMVGFTTGYDFERTGMIFAGRLWSECYAQPNTVGIRFGPNCDNIHISDACIWSCDVPVLVGMANGSGNRVSFGHIWVVHPAYHAMVVQGGNVSFGLMTVRGLKGNESACLNITGAASYVEGTIIDENSGSVSPVLVPEGYTTEKLALLKVRSPYRDPGISRVGGRPVVPPYLTIANQGIALPLDGDEFKIAGTGPLVTIGGGYGGRQISLLFTAAVPVSFSGLNIAGPGASMTAAAGGVMRLYYDAEYASWRFMSYADTSGAGAAPALADGSVTNAKLAQVPAISLIGNRGGSAGGASYGTMSQFLDTIVADAGSMIARGPNGWQTIGYGTFGQVLTSNGAGNVPSYQTAPGNFVQDTRLAFVADLSGSTQIYPSGGTGAGTIYEPYQGAVVTGLAANSSGYLYGARFRYVQNKVNGNWYTIGTA